jgi:hypothetical protein
MRCGHDGDGRRSGALFGGTHSTGHRERFSNALQSRKAASLLAPIAAPGTEHAGHH